jgi:hypothetical protein
MAASRSDRSCYYKWREAVARKKCSADEDAAWDLSQIIGGCMKL